MRLAVGSTLLLGGVRVGSLPGGRARRSASAGSAVGALPHLVPRGTLRRGAGRPAVVAAIFAIAFAFFGTEAFVPLSRRRGARRHRHPGGIALSAAAVTWATASWLQARAAATGMRRALVVGGRRPHRRRDRVIATCCSPACPRWSPAAGWIVAGLGMGLAYSMLTLVVLETATPGEEGFSSAALALMFTLGTAFGAGVGGAMVALAEPARSS